LEYSKTEASGEQTVRIIESQIVPKPSQVHVGEIRMKIFFPTREIGSERSFLFISPIVPVSSAILAAQRQGYRFMSITPSFEIV
jgi:hypothetical protein